MKIALRNVPFTTAQLSELAELTARYGHECRYYDQSMPVTAEELAGCEVLMGYFPLELLPSCSALKWYQTCAAGVERWCAPGVFPPHELTLTNGSGAFGTAIAEYMLTGLLMLLRHMPAYQRNQQQRLWRCAGTCRTVLGSKVCVVGTGNIGTELALRLKALGASVTGVCRTEKEAQPPFDTLLPVTHLREAVQGQDAVALCLPGTPDTRGLISAEILDLMRPDTIVLNCGRGCTIDQTALADRLADGRLGGAVLDVFEQEPLPVDDPLWQLPNVILTPHISGRDGDPVNAELLYRIFRDNLERYFTRAPLLHVVDRAHGY